MLSAKELRSSYLSELDSSESLVEAVDAVEGEESTVDGEELAEAVEGEESAVDGEESAVVGEDSAETAETDSSKGGKGASFGFVNPTSTAGAS